MAIDRPTQSDIDMGHGDNEIQDLIRTHAAPLRRSLKKISTSASSESKELMKDINAVLMVADMLDKNQKVTSDTQVKTYKSMMDLFDKYSKYLDSEGQSSTQEAVEAQKNKAYLTKTFDRLAGRIVQPINRLRDESRPKTADVANKGLTYALAGFLGPAAPIVGLFEDQIKYFKFLSKEEREAEEARKAADQERHEEELEAFKPFSKLAGYFTDRKKTDKKRDRKQEELAEGIAAVTKFNRTTKDDGKSSPLYKLFAKQFKLFGKGGSTAGSGGALASLLGGGEAGMMGKLLKGVLANPEVLAALLAAVGLPIAAWGGWKAGEALNNWLGDKVKEWTGGKSASIGDWLFAKTHDDDINSPTFGRNVFGIEWDKLTTRLKGWVDAIGTAWKNMVDHPMDTLKKMWAGTKDATSSAWNGTKAAASTAWSGAKDTASSVWNGTKEVAGKAATQAQQAVASSGQAAGRAAEYVGNNASAVLYSGSQYAKRAVQSVGKGLSSAYNLATSGWVTGLSESGGDAGKVGKDVLGIKSYGKYQFIKNGQLPGLLAYMKQHGVTAFNGLTPDTDKFDKAWTTYAKSDPKGFEALQDGFKQDFNKKVLDKFAAAGFAVNNPMISEFAISMANQHGGYAKIVKEAAKDPRAKGSPTDQLHALYDARANYINGLSSMNKEQKSQNIRYINDMRKMLEVTGGYMPQNMKANDKEGLIAAHDQGYRFNAATHSASMVGDTSTASAAPAASPGNSVQLPAAGAPATANTTAMGVPTAERVPTQTTTIVQAPPPMIAAPDTAKAPSSSNGLSADSVPFYLNSNESLLAINIVGAMG